MLEILAAVSMLLKQPLDEGSIYSLVSRCLLLVNVSRATDECLHLISRVKC